MYSRKQFAFAALSVLATLALAGTLETTLALESGPGTPPPAWHGHEGHMRGRGAEGGVMQVLRQLRLSDPQRQQLRSIMETERTQGRALGDATVSDLVALGNPGDPGHAAAVQAAQARAAERIRHWDGIQQQVYALLTPAQQAQLPQLLKAMQDRVTAGRAAHAPPAGTPGAR
jgi:Spy/CpxP family protein refolding chaperone